MISARTPSDEWIPLEEDRVRASWFGRLTTRWWGRALVAAIGWTGVSVMFALPNLMMGGFERELKTYFAQFWAWGLVTPLIIALDRRLPFSGRQLGMRVLAHLAASPVITLIGFYIMVLLRVALGLSPPSSMYPGQVFSRMMIGWQLWFWLIYWIVAGAIQAY